ncbi:MAG: hypothetical protein ACAI44_20435 [Candidatus Sericytochromatia bacterium]
MKRHFCSALLLTTLLSSCQALPFDSLIVPGPGASAQPGAPGEFPTGEPSHAIPIPTPTPSPEYTSTPYPDVSPTPGTEDVETKREADVTAKRESRVLESVQPNADGSRILYRYRRALEADLSGWYYNPATRSLESGLWLYEAASGSQRQIQLVSGMADWSEFFWIDTHTIAWIADSGDELLSLDLSNGARRSLLKADSLSGLTQQGDQLYMVAVENKQQNLLRLNPATGESLRTPLPYQDFYFESYQVHVLSPEQVLIGRAKRYEQAGQYPFRVMMTGTPAPPVIDSYLVSLPSGQAQVLKGGLDLFYSQKVSPAPDGAHYLVQKSEGTLIYNLAGEQVMQADGQASWLDADHLLILAPLGLTIRRLSNGETSYSASTQNRCTHVQRAAAGQILVQCEVRLEGKDLTRVYRLSGPLASEPLRELDLQLPDDAQAELGPQGVILAHVPGPEGHTAAYTLDAQGRPQTLLQLNNPIRPDFVFDPVHDSWGRS